MASTSEPFFARGLGLAASTQAFAGLLGVFFLAVMSLAVARSVDRVTAGGEPIARSTGMRINPNTADAAMLELLPGVGPGIADHIVETRVRGQNFQCADDLQAVKYIGPRLVERVGPWTTYAGDGSSEAKGALPLSDAE